MSRLLLARIFFPVLTLGYGRRLGVWVRGCARRCPGCISPELQSYVGTAVEVAQIIASLPKDFSADGLTVSGGEPFDQAEALGELVEWFSDTVSADVLIYTGYTLEELRARGDPATERLLSRTAVLVDGPYIEALNEGRGLMGSSNQRVFVWKFAERYPHVRDAVRQVQFVGSGDRLVQIGVPPRFDSGDRLL